MDIAYVLADQIHPDGSSGAAAHVRNVIRELRELGHAVDLIAHDVAPPDDEEDDPESARATLRSVAKEYVVHALPEGVQRALHGAYRRLQNRRLLRRHADRIKSTDLIYERDTYQNLAVAPYADREHLPWVIECNGLFWGRESVFRPPWNPRRYRNRHVDKWKRASHLIAVSGPLKRRIMDEGVSGAKITVIHNGVDPTPYRQVNERDVTELRSRLGLTDHVTVGFLGHVLPKHRLDLLLRALQPVANGRRVKALIVGGGHVAEYEHMAREADLREQVIFTGAVDPAKVPLYVSAMDICTVPGTSELDSPVKIFDYGAAQKAVVAADFAGVKEILTEDVDGMFFTGGSHRDFSDRLEQLVDNRDLRERLGSHLFETVVQNHTWEQVGKRTDAVLNDVVRSHNATVH